ncbi:hypothetical protein AX16_002387 [Volvariella volvacea WC 439]|nr:hypothetical protein AX16_002387 [Volvariella volvacea WC 439]
MSSKRGRKRNDNLPPNRARDVQRAFRARRAAHLQALEQRVSELEEENNCLRQALNLPPANRPPLGKGPTGKDKPKTYEGGATNSLAFQADTRASTSTTESPASTRTSSLSPSTVTSSVTSHSLHVINGSTWEQPMILADQSPTTTMQPPEATYTLSSMSAGVSSKPIQYPHYNSSGSVPSPSTRPPNNESMYLPQQGYPQAAERAVTNNYTTQSFVLRETRDHQRQYSYAGHSSYQTHESLHPQSPPPPVPSLHSHPPVHRDPPLSLPYPHRRSLTDPQGFSMAHSYSHLTSPPPIPGPSRPPELPRLQGGTSHTFPPTPAPRQHYGSDDRVNPMQ